MMGEAPVKFIHLQPVEKPSQESTKALTTSYPFASSDRPYACPYKGCEKSYILEYKLNNHLKGEHHAQFSEENAKNVPDNELDISQKQDRPKPYVKLPPAKVTKQKASTIDHDLTSVVKKQPWPMVKYLYHEENSEETEEDCESCDNDEDQWGYGGVNVDDDDNEEIEYED